MTKKFLRGQVVRIIDDQRLVINLGADHGVRVGDQFCIYDLGEEIHDTQTNEPLGQLELIKAMVEAVHVQERITTVMPPKHAQPAQATVLSEVLARVPPTGKGDPSRDRLFVQREQIGGMMVTGPILTGNMVRSVQQYEV
ncbi:MAG: FlgT C-terminal domain-containing protein [bacterium]|jgi:hypothetical protein